MLSVYAEVTALSDLLVVVACFVTQRKLSCVYRVDVDAIAGDHSRGIGVINEEASDIGVSN